MKTYEVTYKVIIKSATDDLRSVEDEAWDVMINTYVDPEIKEIK